MTTTTCPSCASPIEPDRIEGLCPACLLAAVVFPCQEEGRPEGTAALDAPPTPDMPPTVGPYTPVRVLGEGGMGVVYLARQASPIARDVAIKVRANASAGVAMAH